MKKRIAILLLGVFLLGGCEWTPPRQRLYDHFIRRETEFYLFTDDPTAAFREMFAAYPQQQVYLGSVSSTPGMFGQKITVSYENTHIDEKDIFCGTQEEIAVKAVKQTLARVEQEGVIVLLDQSEQPDPLEYCDAVAQEHYLSYMGLRTATWSVVTNQFTDDTILLLQAEYDDAPDRILSYRQQTAKRVEELSAQLWLEETPPEKRVRAIHDWLIDNSVYHQGEQDVLIDHTAYGPLVAGRGVCDGYTHAAALLLDAAGIDNMVVEGEGLNEPHSWNMVELDGEYYHMDVTWDDPVDGVGGEHHIFAFYLKGDDVMKQEHSWQTDAVPQCPKDYPLY